MGLTVLLEPYLDQLDGEDSECTDTDYLLLSDHLPSIVGILFRQSLRARLPEDGSERAVGNWRFRSLDTSVSKRGRLCLKVQHLGNAGLYQSSLVSTASLEAR